ncbi:MAG: helix-turn-helix domain-containing protein [Brachyspira sp.]|nr:helix-turn-helix domain-containing protein [Brachyspira sp.]
MKLITIDELSTLLQTSKSTIYRWVHKREIPFVKLGGKLLFSQDEIQEYIKKNSVSNL